MPFAHVCVLRARLADVSLPAGSGHGLRVLPVPVLNIKSGSGKKKKKIVFHEIASVHIGFLQNSIALSPDRKVLALSPDRKVLVTEPGR